MRVRWDFSRQHILEAELDTLGARIFMWNSRGEFPSYSALIGDNHNGPRKSDNSLLELMNWVEEELKFRWSHGSDEIYY